MHWYWIVAIIIAAVYLIVGMLLAVFDRIWRDRGPLSIILFILCWPLEFDFNLEPLSACH
jgi:hypothetical protein